MTSIKIDWVENIRRHMDRISNLSGMMLGEFITDDGVHVENKEENKQNAFAWLVEVMGAFVPEEVHDKQFRDEVMQLNKDHGIDLNELSGVELAKKHGEAMSTLPATYYVELLHYIVNSLYRRGILFDRNITALIGYDPDDEDPEEYKKRDEAEKKLIEKSKEEKQENDDEEVSSEDEEGEE